MIKPGIHSITPAVYYSDTLTEEPSLNATVAKLLISDSPLHARTAHAKLNPNYAEKIDKKFDVGKVVHALFLQGELITEEDDVFQVDDEAVCAATLVKVEGKPFALSVDADDWRTKIAKNVRAEARRRGLVPLLDDQWREARTIVAAIRPQLPGIDTLGLPGLFTAGKPEQTLVWRDRGVLCRARLDWLHDSLECVDDLKSAGRSANPHVWTRTTMWGIGADIQAAFTLRGLKAACGVDSTFRFVIAETHEPYAISAVTPSPQALALSNAKIDVALEKWKECLRTDAWPSYPPAVLTVDPPPWLESQWWEAQQLDEQIAAAA